MAEFLQSIPVLVKVLGALGLILVVNFFTRNLLASVCMGALALAITSSHSIQGMAAITGSRIVSIDNVFLMLVVCQVIWLSSQMATTNMMAEMVYAVRSRIHRRGAMAILPAVIGLLPMPGGALFSAPLVDSCDTHDSMEAKLKAQTNHWFRHVWEYWWPLYPGVLLAMEITGLGVGQFMLMGIPLSVCAVGAGYFFLLRRIPATYDDPGDDDTPNGKSLLELFLPIVVVVAVYMMFKLIHFVMQRFWGFTPPLNRYLPMITGLFCAMLVLQYRRPLGRREWRNILFSKRVLSMVLIVVAVRVYGAFVEARLPGGELLVEKMRSDLASWGIPLTAIIMLIPFVSGLATGLSIGFVGASLPIVMSLIGNDPSFGVLLSTTVLAYGFGYIGMLLSPVHVCLVVTSEHFDTGLPGNIIGMVAPASVVMCASVVLHLMWKFLL